MPKQVEAPIYGEREEAWQDRLVHHSDRGVQYLSIRYTERLAEAGIEPSVGSRGDSYDNALAESVIGLFKTEVIHRRGTWHGLEGVEFATLEWVWWFNHHRLLVPLGYVPPVEYEEAFYRRQETQSLVPALVSWALRKTRRGSNGAIRETCGARARAGCSREGRCLRRAP